MKKIIILGILLASLITLGGGIANNKHPEQEIIKNENVNLAIYLNDTKTSSIPSKEGNVFDEEKSTCTNDAYIVWDYSSWSPIIKNVSNYPVRCNLYFKTEYNESILNGAYPVLDEPLIAVTIESDGTVKRADLSSKWYSYEEKTWANAIILKDESTNNNYAVGATIPEEAIEAYFVWIPKYRYQLWDLGLYDSLTKIDTTKPHEIPIIFGDYNTSDSVNGECTTPMESGTSGNCNVGDYMTHPAFISIPSKGFWVGKFETGYEGATSTIEAEVNERDAIKIIVKPNVYSWRGIQVANAFFTSYDYKRNLDSHMMKNTEWGAIAYLQHSKYGSGTNVRLNNNSASITGYQANNEPTCGYTGTNEECNRYCNDKSCNVSYPNSVLASTTNNISGIFDMSGGAAEYVMSFVKDNNNNYIIGRHNEATSGFKGILGCPTCDNNTSGIIEIKGGENIPSSNYYDIYINTANNNYDYFNRILGDATGEMGPFWRLNSRNLGSWYSNHSFYIRPHQPFYQRGGYYENGMEPGMFYFGLANGSIYETNTFRLVLTPTI